MSRMVSWSVSVECLPGEAGEVCDALTPIIDADGDDHWYKGHLSMNGEASLTCGQSADQVAEVVYATACAVLKRDTDVKVVATYLEECPYEVFHFGEEETT